MVSADIVDLDDDNDGILDTEEGAFFPPEVVDFSNSLDGTTASGVIVYWHIVRRRCR